jgi:hypothetical protein
MQIYERKDLAGQMRALRPKRNESDFVSHWEDRDDVKVARVKRSIHRTARVVSDAREELETHQRWLNKHREVWAKEVTSLERHIKARSFVRLVVRRLVTFPVAAVILLFDLLQRALQHQFCSIHRLPSTKKLAPLRTVSRDGRPTHGTVWISPRLVVLIPVLIALLLIAQHGVRAMMPAAQTPEKIALDPIRSVTVQKKRAQRIRGFGLAAVAVPERISMPPRTVMDIVSITTPWTLAPIETHTVAAPIEQALPAARPKVRAKIKRRSAAQEPRSRPWWQALPWIRVQ